MRPGLWVIAASFAAIGCGGATGAAPPSAGGASATASSTAAAAATAESASAPAASATTPPPATAALECSVKGTWEITIVNEGGCPVPSRIVLVDGRGTSSDPSARAMDWTLTALGGAVDTCRYELDGTAGRIFRVDGEIGAQGSKLIGTGHAKAGVTAYSCGGPMKFSGERH